MALLKIKKKCHKKNLNTLVIKLYKHINDLITLGFSSILITLKKFNYVRTKLWAQFLFEKPKSQNQSDALSVC
ncbi:hypothetical protein EG344_01620 [Chryseobacterium sp. G0162]|nr:hypothetical protein EG344_01620 [Chryseobacterium sp. G0162]